MPIISTNTIWRSGEIHDLGGAILQIANGVTLTIEAGVQVSNGTIQSFGVLNVQGTAQSKVKFENTRFTYGSTDATHVGAIKIAYADIIGGAILPAGESSGNYGAAISLTDSVIIDTSYMYLWYPSADSYIERNVFKSSGGISVGHSDNHSVYIRNNVFLNQTTSYAVQNWASYSGKTIVENNSFLSTNKIALSVPGGYTSAAISAANNYFGSTDLSVINKMIFDQLDDLSSASIINTSHTQFPSPNTPQLTNSSPTGSVFTNSNGILTPTHVLNAVNNLVDVDGIGIISYQWQANGVNIPNETSEYLTLTQAMVGKNISVMASYTDGIGTLEHVSSNPLLISANVNHLPTGTVSIIGSPTQGQALTATNTLADADGLGVISYQWQANGIDIPKATMDTLTLKQSEVDKVISVVAIYTDKGGALERKTSLSTTPVVNINDAPTFINSNGTFTQSFNDNYTYANGVIIQSDGKIFITTNGQSSDTKGNLLSYDENGILNVNFEKNGILALDFVPHDIISLGNNEFLIVGRTDNQTTLRKFNKDGSANVNFGINGIIEIPKSRPNDKDKIVLQPDGKIIISSFAGNETDFSLIRLNSNGTLDTSFGNEGFVSIDYQGANALIVNQTATYDANGKILIGGYIVKNDTINFVITRFTNNGAIDTEYGTNGLIITDLDSKSGYPNYLENMKLQPDGKLIVTGQSSGKLVLARFNPDGTLDTSFGNQGKVFTQTSAQGSTLILDKNGNIFVGGSSVNANNYWIATIWKFSPDGQSVLSFGEHGVSYPFVGELADINGYEGSIFSFAKNFNGEIIAVGTAMKDVFAVEYNNDGTLNTHFGTQFNTLNATPTYVENSSAVLLDENVFVFDADLTLIGNYDGATLTLSRHGVASPEDFFSTNNDALTSLFTGSYFAVNGVTIGRVTSNSNGALILKFNSNATESLVNSTMQHIAYTNLSENPPSKVQIDWTFNDGNTGAQGAGGAGIITSSSFVNITPVNDYPYLTTQIPNIVIEPNATLNAILPPNTFVDPENDKLTYSLGMVDGTGVPPWLHIDSATGTLTGSPGKDDLGDLYVRIVATDSAGASTTGYSHVKVVSNSAPVFTGSPLILSPGLEDIGYGISANILLYGWSDPDAGNSLNVSNLKADHGTVVLNAINHYIITPEPNFNGKMTLSYNVTDGIVSVSTVQSYIVSPANDAPTGGVTIAGTTTENQTLVASNTIADIDGLGTLRYQWKSNGNDIAQATSSTLTLTQAEVGKTISVVVSYTDGGGTVENIMSSSTSVVANVNDRPTGNVVITGQAIQNQTLTATNNLADLDGLGVLYFQWKADGIDILNANASTYKLTQSEVNKSVTVAINYVDNFGTLETKVSLMTEKIVNVNDAPTGNAVIYGLPQKGQTLTISNNIVDLDGLGTMHYQWQANGVDIPNATGISYTLTQTEIGKNVAVVVSYIDGGGTAERKLSTSTGLVTNLNSVPTGSVVIAGTLFEGQTISATNSINDLDGIASSTIFTYKWTSNGELITGANSSNLLLTHDLAGKSIEVTISYTDNLGTLEFISSKNSTPVGGKYLGTSNNDTLTGSNGNDTIDGGANFDIVSYLGSIDQYAISRTGTNYSVKDKLGTAGVDTLSNIESIKFSDMSVNLQVQNIAASAPQANVQRLKELYIAFFNRIPDADGLAYWIGQMKAGQTTDQIAATFYNAGVQYSNLTGFSASMTNTDFINVVYKNVLGRSDGADAGGLNYWGGKLADGSATRGSLVSTILDAAHGFKSDTTWGWVANLLDNKIAVARTFAIDLGLSYLTPSDSITHGMAIAAAVTSTDTSTALSLIGISQQDIQLM